MAASEHGANEVPERGTNASTRPERTRRLLRRVSRPTVHPAKTCRDLADRRVIPRPTSGARQGRPSDLIRSTGA